MNLFQNKIYGSWFDENMEFSFFKNGICEIKWLKGNSKKSGLYEIIDNKLIISYGNGNSVKWIAKIVNIDDSLLEVVDLNGNNVNGIEKYTKKKHIEKTINNKEISNHSIGKTMLKFSENNAVTPFGCIGSLIIVAFVLTVFFGAYKGVVEIFSELPTWLSTILGSAPFIGFIFYINRDK